MLKRIGCLLGAAFACVASTAMAGEQTYEFRNGRWFDGEKFTSKKSAYAQWGRLQFTRPDSIGKTIDLDGGFVIPPLCEAHNHNLGGDYQTRQTLDAYLEAGVFYVMIFSNLPLETGKERHLFNRPDSVDVAFANGGLTGPGGHPIALRERLLSYGAYEGFTKETLKDHAYFVFREPGDIDEKWPVILSYQPDFIKIFLLHSEEYEERRDDPAYFGKKGLDPALVPLLVERAHRHDLRVAAHVNTAHDFHVAVEAGVDIIAHLPGRRAPQKIDPADAALAAERGVTVITTASLAEKQREEDPALFADIRAAQIENLQRLKETGVKLAVGSDEFESTSKVEADYLRDLGVFSDRELLNMWTRQCAKTVFPERHVGELRDNYEASFIVLEENPLETWTALENIRLRVKDGEPMTLE